MSEIAFLEKLLDGVEVEWKPLGEVTQRTSNIKWRDATRSYQYIDLTSVSVETVIPPKNSGAQKQSFP